MLTRLLTSFARRVPVFVTVEDLGRPRRWNVDEILARVENKVDPLESSSPDHWDKQGLYAWYVDAHGQDVLRKAGLYVRRDGLAYVGMTTKQNFKKRLKQQVDRKPRQETERPAGSADLRSRRAIQQRWRGGTPAPLHGGHDAGSVRLRGARSPRGARHHRGGGAMSQPERRPRQLTESQAAHRVDGARQDDAR